MRRLIIIFLGAFVVAAVCRAEAQVILKDQKARDSYSLGYEYGSSLKRQPLDIDTDMLVRAIRDAMEGKRPALTPAEMSETLSDVRKKAIILQDRRVREEASVNLMREKEFLEANGKKAGVTTLPDGVQFKVIKEGNGEYPKKGDLVKVNYRGTLVDGTEFDSTLRQNKPAAMPVSGGIRGLGEVLPMMRSGAKWQIVIPSRLAYGERSYSRIPPNSTLIFDLELVSIVREKNGIRKPGEAVTPDPPPHP